MKTKRKIHFLPKTKLGKLSAWTAVICFIGIYLQYWIAMITKSSVPPIFGLLFMGLLVISGITSIVTIIKYKDYAIILFLAALFGILGILFVLGEFLLPH